MRSRYQISITSSIGRSVVDCPTRLLAEQFIRSFSAGHEVMTYETLENTDIDFDFPEIGRIWLRPIGNGVHQGIILRIYEYF